MFTIAQFPVCFDQRATSALEQYLLQHPLYISQHISQQRVHPVQLCAVLRELYQTYTTSWGLRNGAACFEQYVHQLVQNPIVVAGATRMHMLDHVVMCVALCEQQYKQGVLSNFAQQIMGMRVLSYWANLK